MFLQNHIYIETSCLLSYNFIFHDVKLSISRLWWCSGLVQAEKKHLTESGKDPVLVLKH